MPVAEKVAVMRAALERIKVWVPITDEPAARVCSADA